MRSESQVSADEEVKAQRAPEPSRSGCWLELGKHKTRDDAWDFAERGWPHATSKSDRRGSRSGGCQNPNFLLFHPPMGTRHRQGWCPKHGEVLAVAKTPNHILHLLLTLITSGLWIIVWIVLSFSTRVFRCTQCGAKTSDKAPGGFSL